MQLQHSLGFPQSNWNIIAEEQNVSSLRNTLLLQKFVSDHFLVFISQWHDINHKRLHTKIHWFFCELLYFSLWTFWFFFLKAHRYGPKCHATRFTAVQIKRHTYGRKCKAPKPWEVTNLSLSLSLSTEAKINWRDDFLSSSHDILSEILNTTK